MSYIGNQPTSVAFLTDQFSGTGSQTAFTLSAAPANTASIIVAVSGVLQDPTTYSTSGLTLTFSAAPPSGTGNISVRFLGIPASNIATTAYRTLTEFTATAGQTTFTPPSYTVGYITVLRNGVQLGTADFTATNGTTVVLASGATAGDLITTISFYVSSVLNAIPAVAGAVTDTYLNAGAVTQSKLGTGVAGNGPAFSAYLSGNQTVTTQTFVKITCQTEEFDTASAYDNSTNYRFQPTVAGYYDVSATVYFNTETRGIVAIYKNGSQFKNGNDITCTALRSSNMDCLVYLNGSTDYIELYAWTQGTTILGGQPYQTYFQASLVRSA